MLSILGVITSLIFVGIQLMLDRRVALGNSYQARAESRMENIRRQVDSEQFVQDQVKVIESGRNIYYWSPAVEHAVEDIDYSLDELVRRALDAQIDMVSFDNVYYQRSQNLLDESYWTAVETVLRTVHADLPFEWEQYLIAPVSANFKQYLIEFGEKLDGT